MSKNKKQINKQQEYLLPSIEQYRELVKEVGDSITNYQARRDLDELYVINPKEHDFLTFEFYPSLQTLDKFLPIELTRDIRQTILNARPVLSSIFGEEDYEKYKDGSFALQDVQKLVDAYTATGKIADKILEPTKPAGQLVADALDKEAKVVAGQRASGKSGDTKARFEFNKSQAFFDGRDLELPTGAEIKAVDILKMLVKSFGQVVQYNKLDTTPFVDPNSESASDVLRQKILAIKAALKKHKVPCKIQSKKWDGYCLSYSRGHS